MRPCLNHPTLTTLSVVCNRFWRIRPIYKQVLIFPMPLPFDVLLAILQGLDTTDVVRAGMVSSLMAVVSRQS